MRIALLAHMHKPIVEPYEGGTEAHTGMLADSLVARGHDVTLFAKEGSVSSATLHPLVPHDFEFVNLASPLVRKQQRGFLAEAVLRSIDMISRGGYDVVINNSLSSLPYSFMRELPMMTVLHTPANLDDITTIISRPGWTPSALHEYVTVSEANAAAWRMLLPDVRVVPNGIHPERWVSAAEPQPDLAVWAARITREKGLHLAIDAARAAGMRFAFAGPVSRQDYFDAEIAPRLGADVRYHGHVSHAELADFLSSGSVFVASPLWEEPFGLTVIEALASGTPVAALPHGAMRELVAPTAGAVAADDSVDALAAAITRARSMSRSDARRSAAPFAFDTMVDRYEAVLDELLERGSRSEAWPA